MKILLTDSRLLNHPTLEPLMQEMLAAGHTIDVKDELGEEYTFIAGFNCWYLVPEVADLFRSALRIQRRTDADQAGAEQPAAQAVAQRKPRKRSAGGGQDQAARRKKGQPSPYS